VTFAEEQPQSIARTYIERSFQNDRFREKRDANRTISHLFCLWSKNVARQRSILMRTRRRVRFPRNASSVEGDCLVMTISEHKQTRPPLIRTVSELKQLLDMVSDLQSQGASNSTIQSEVQQQYGLTLTDLQLRGLVATVKH